MSTTPETDARRAAIGLLKLDARRMLDGQLDPSMKELVRLAVRDYDEALVWLRQDNVENRPYILGIADLATEFGQRRIAMVSDGLARWARVAPPTRSS